MSRSSGGPPPQGNGSRPVHSCEACGTMHTGGVHTCRQVTSDGEAAWQHARAEHEAWQRQQAAEPELEKEAG